MITYPDFLIKYTDGTALHLIPFHFPSGFEYDIYINERGTAFTHNIINCILFYWDGTKWVYQFNEKTDMTGNKWKIVCPDPTDFDSLHLIIGSWDLHVGFYGFDESNPVFFYGAYDVTDQTLVIADSNGGDYVHSKWFINGVNNAGMTVQAFLSLITDRYEYQNIVPSSSGFYSTLCGYKTDSPYDPQQQEIDLLRYGAQSTGTGIAYGTYTPSTGEVDPYSPGGTSKPGGGNGDWDDRSDKIGIPPLPTTGVIDTGFVTLYNPSLSQVKAFAGYMWSDLLDPATIEKLFVNAMDSVICLNAFPFAIPHQSPRAIVVGKHATSVTANVAASQYVEIDCGTLTIPEYYGSYLDYSPYTKIDLYLPGSGVHSMSPDEIIGKPVKVVYHCDIFTGQATIFVKCGESVLYTFECNLATSIPMASPDYASMLGRLVSTAVSAGVGAITGTTTSSDALSNSMTALGVVCTKPAFQRSGSMGGSSAIMGNKKPFFIITRTNQCLPADQFNFTGYPSFTTETIGSCKGYLEIEEVHLENISALEEEKLEIEQLLKGGVLL